MVLVDRVERGLGFAGVALLVLACGSGALWAASSQEIIQTFEVASGGLLKVEAERGSIEVKSGSTSQIEVRIDPKGLDLDDFEDKFDVRFNQTGNDVFVEIKEKGSISKWFNFGSKGFALYAIVPYEFSVNLMTSGGSISVVDLQGDVKSLTSGGSLQFGQIVGPIEGRTSGGSVKLTQCTGDVNVRTSGGSIQLGEVDGSVQARTSGGPIKIESAHGPVTAETSGGSISARLLGQPDDDCRLSTSGGSINVTLDGNVSMTIDAETSGGRIKSDLPLTVNGRFGQSRLEGELNGGGPELVLRTSGGSINIKESSLL